MKKAKNTLARISQFLVVLIALLAILVTMIYPFKRQDLFVEVITNNGKETRMFSSQYIKSAESISFDFDKDVVIKEIRIYRNFKSMCLQKIYSDKLLNYIQNGEMTSVYEWTEDGVHFSGEAGIHITLNEEGTKVFKELSSSLILERMVCAEGIAIIAALLLLCIKIIRELCCRDEHRNDGPIYEIRKFFADIKKYWQYMLYAAKTDLNAEVANSYLNRLWWLLEPFFNMLVYVIVFGRVMGNSIQNYATFTFSALLMWNFFSKTINYSVKLVRNNRDIVTKVYVPKCVLLISNMILNFYKLLFSLIVLIPMLIIFHVKIGMAVLWIIPAYVMMILLSFGVGMIFLHFGVYIDDLSYAVGILLQMMMFLSGVFYEVLTSLPNPLNVLMMCLNPAAIFIDTMRNGLLYNTVTNLPVLVTWLMLSLICCYVGIHIVYNNENGYVKVV